MVKIDFTFEQRRDVLLAFCPLFQSGYNHVFAMRNKDVGGINIFWYGGEITNVQNIFTLRMSMFLKRVRLYIP